MPEPLRTAPELFTSPTTGQQRMIETRYDTGADNINPQAIQRLFETQKIADAEKALSAAIQFQGLRGYQKALQAGEPAEKALTRYGPMMFYQKPSAIGSAIRSVTPKVTPPMIRSVPGGGFVKIDPATDAVKTLREPTPRITKPEKFSAAVGTSLDPFGQPTRLPMTAKQFQNFMTTASPELKTNAVNIAISRMLQPPTAETNAPAKTKRLRYNPQTGDFEQ